jgi:hypothetical protein
MTKHMVAPNKLGLGKLSPTICDDSLHVYHHSALKLKSGEINRIRNHSRGKQMKMAIIITT